MLKGEGNSGAVCQLAASGGSSTVSVERGVAQIHGAGQPVTISSGHWARLEAGPQAAGQPQLAGKVARQIPKGMVQRQGQGQSIVLNLNDGIDWNDLVRTEKAGRVQIALLDGSLLNVGARSEMRILKHDPDTQQTQIEMAVGKMRADVQKVTKSGGKFEVRTKTAVIGVVGTELAIDGGKPNSTTVCDVSGGDVTAQNRDPNVAGTQTLHPGQCAVIPLGLAPAALGSAAATSAISSVTSATTINAAAVGAVGAAAGAAAGTAAGTVAGVSTGVAVVAAVGTGVAVAAVVDKAVVSPPTPVSPSAP